ncbi:DUF485 domain-containing protein [Streptomyces sp. NPDC052036]|uniref:DUF485 domain-containing protein n=1 Tax=Streptomyces sp. NPDC052036 TaxID=3155171 RepID=UPI0034398AE0
MNGYPPQHAGRSPSSSPSSSPSPSPAADSASPPSLRDHPEFPPLRHAFRALGATTAALVVGAFLLYVLLSSFAPGLMNQPLVGHLTLGLALGLAQFGLMALAVRRYTVHMRNRVDPVVRRLRSERDRARPAGRPRSAQRRWPRTW